MTGEDCMDVPEIITKLTDIIVTELDLNLTREAIDPSATLFEGGLGFDSVVIVEMIALIEERFHFTFARDELDMEMFANLRTLADFLHKKITLPADNAHNLH